MFVGRQPEIDTIQGQLATDNTSADCTAVIAVYGLFGAGKTTLLRKIRSQVETEQLAEALFVTDEDITTTTLPEFVFDLANSFQSLNEAFPRFSIDETDARRRRYLQIIGKLGADTMPILQRLRVEERSHDAAASPDKQQASKELIALEFAIKNQFNNADDQRLILDTGNVMSESLIVDIMNTFFPLTDKIKSLDYYLVKKLAPKKIVILIDTFEKISTMVNPWLLESFLPYMLQKRFGDFRCYRTPALPDKTHVREFIDVRLIVAGRERLLLTDNERRWDRYRDNMSEVGLGSFNRKELQQYLKHFGITNAQDVTKVMDLTQGLPYLVALWVDATRAHPDGSEDAFVSALAEQRIFWYKTPQQQEWIRAAAFLDWFDADALQCFSTVQDQCEQAFEYLRSSSEVARPSAGNPGKFEVHGIIRAALRGSTRQQSEQRAKEFQEAAAAFYAASELLDGFDATERRMLRRLAYLERFDDFAFENMFGGEAQYARALLTHSNGTIIHNAHTFSINPDAASILHRYNRCADRNNYTANLEQAKVLWEMRRTMLTNSITVARRTIGDIANKLRSFGVKQNVKSEQQQHTRQSVLDLKSELNVAKRKWGWQLSDRDVVLARSSFFFLVFFVLAMALAGELPIPEDTQDVLRIASMALSALFLGIFALMLGRILYNRSRRIEQQALREDVMSVEDRLNAKQFELYELAAETEGAAAEIEALSAQRQQLLSQIEEYEQRLLEPYI